MNAIAAGDVKALRDRTGAGMMECKKALQESSGNVDDAIAWLRKNGLSKAAKKAERTAKEGTIAIAIASDQQSGVMVEIHCETDFVAKTDEFQAFAAAVAQQVGASRANDLDAVLGLQVDGQGIKDRQTELTAKLGEHIGVSRVVRQTANGAGQKVAQYMHAGNKIGVLVCFEDSANQLTDEAAKDIAMHVAAMNPQYVNREQVPADTVEKEREILRGQVGDAKKPPEIIEKIVTGRIQKFFSEMCLEEQIFVKDPQGKRTVKQALQAVGDKIRLISMERLQVGAGG